MQFKLSLNKIFLILCAALIGACSTSQMTSRVKNAPSQAASQAASQSVGQVAGPRAGQAAGQVVGQTVENLPNNNIDEMLAESEPIRMLVAQSSAIN